MTRELPGAGMRPGRRRRAAAPVAAAAAAACLCACSGPPSGSPPSGRAGADRPVPVGVAVVQVQAVPLTLSGLGVAAAARSAAVRPQVDGVITAVPLVEGATVARGDVLATLDPRPYAAALASAEAALGRDRAVAAHAAQVAARTLGLRGRDLVAAQDLDDAQATAAEAAATVHLDVAQVETAKLQLGYTRLVAPFAGRLGTRRIDPGNLVRAGDANALVVVSQLDPIAVMVSLPVTDRAALEAARARGPVAARAFATADAEPLATGTLVAIDNAIDAATATLRAKVCLDNRAGRIWPGELVRVELTRATLAQARVFPAAALQAGPEGSFVFVVDRAGHARRRSVAPATEPDVQAVVASGLEAGERVVIEGAHLLRDGDAVDLTPAPAPPASAPAAGPAAPP